ncbi:MAG: V-type ATP synthase subunit I [Marinifilaceae bacterium]|jgi:V/A-type H+-transporting ATPase subunit I|nr:V-type ATP synthase subunit I [Marinifilaceae bacterium]
MIVPMRKLTALVFYKDYPLFLEKLRDLGVLHIFTKKNINLENKEINNQMNTLKAYNDNIKFIKKFSGSNSGSIDENGKSIFLKIINYRKELDSISLKLSNISKRKDLLMPWGKFDISKLELLKEAGVNLNFYTCASNKYSDKWNDLYNAIEIEESNGVTYFITITSDKKIDIDAEYFDFGLDSISSLKIKEKEILERKEEIKRYFEKVANSISILENERSNIKEDLDYQKIFNSTNYAIEEKLIGLEAWLPLENEKEISEWIKDKDVYYLIEKPNVEDNVPVKLKNNRFTSLFEMIGKLYSLPNYNEIDLTPFFAPFYLLFFGLCLGDCGYGLLILGGATFYKRKVDKKMKPVITLLQWLGFSTVLMGLLVGTFFGINLINADISFLDGIRDYMLDSNKLFTFSLILGAIQVVFGMFLKVANSVKQFGWGAALSTIGWIVLIFGSAVSYYLKDRGVSYYNIVQNGTLIISGILILLLNNPKRNLFINLGSGLWDTYSMVTGLVGDLLSYIRIFALGVCSGVLGLVFNDIAINLSSGMPPVISQLFMVIILVFGHGINIFMSGLGSMVHPMRLTFVEFYKNAGFAGGGKDYIPFKKIERI